MKAALEKEFVDMVKQSENVIYKVASFYATRENPISDLYQEVVINLWKNFSSFRGESKYSTWVYRVAINTCISFYRRNKSKPVYVDLSFDVPEQVENNDNIRQLYALIDKLEKIERALILLYLDDKPYNEMAEITGLTVSNVATKLSRIKEKLKKMSNN